MLVVQTERRSFTKLRMGRNGGRRNYRGFALYRVAATYPHGVLIEIRDPNRANRAKGLEVESRNPLTLVL